MQARKTESDADGGLLRVDDRVIVHAVVTQTNRFVARTVVTVIDIDRICRYR